MKFEVAIPVRFRDTDMMGHVNNSVYFTYMEEARIQFVREWLGDDVMPLILAAANVNFRAQTFFGQTLRIFNWISRIGTSSFDCACQMRDERTGQSVFEGVVTIVYFDYEQQKSLPIPDHIRARLAAYEEPESPNSTGERLDVAGD